ncbi:MAG: hypothetical protein NTW96_08355 [Planctomycetia bacterium]|nr:hypothetical protein [Planctomycetia bacterium]
MDERDDLRHGWPRCPHCDAPRITRCPICETTGSDFPEADTEYVWGLGLEQVPETEPGNCGSGTCGTASSCARQDASDGNVSEFDDQNNGEPASPVLMCPTCDEPFLPAYPRRCAWCGYDFQEGYEVDVVGQPPEQLGARVILLLLGMAALLALVLGYFMVIV